MTRRCAENDHFPCRHDAVASPMSYLYPLWSRHDGKTGDHGLSREKKMHDVSEPYLMLCWIISAQKLPSLAPIAAANTEAVSSKNDAIRAYFAWHSTFWGLKAASFGRIYVILHLLCCGVRPGLTVWRRFVHIRFH